MWRQNHDNTGDVPLIERLGMSTGQPEERILTFTDSPLPLPPREVFIPGPLGSFGEGTLRQVHIRVPGALVSNAIASHRIISEQRLLSLRNNMSNMSPRVISRG